MGTAGIDACITLTIDQNEHDSQLFKIDIYRASENSRFMYTRNCIADLPKEAATLVLDRIVPVGEKEF